MTEFTLNEKEQAAYDAFRAKHCGSVYLKFKTGSGIGVNIYVGCDGCETEQDITDYESW